VKLQLHIACCMILAVFAGSMSEMIRAKGYARTFTLSACANTLVISWEMAYPFVERTNTYWLGDMYMAMLINYVFCTSAAGAASVGFMGGMFLGRWMHASPSQK
jgi:hypothetical protein